MTKLQQLQRMVEVTPVLRDYAPKVVYTRGQGYHVHRDDGMNTLWFPTFEVGQAYLSAWIGSGRQPSLANIRQGVKYPRTAAQMVEPDPQTSVPMPTGDSAADDVVAPSDPVAADDEPAPGEVCDSCGSDDLIDLSPGWIQCQNCGHSWDYDEHPFEFDDGFVPEENDPADDYGAAYPIYDDSREYLEGDECNMCGKERTLNEKGYCASCWTIWNG